MVDKLPATCDDMLLADIIKKSIVNQADMVSLKAIYTMEGLMNHVYVRYVCDINIILSAMKPIHNLTTPTNDIKAIKNIDIILGIIDTIKEAKLMDQITTNMLSVIESKAVSKIIGIVITMYGLKYSDS